MDSNNESYQSKTLLSLLSSMCQHLNCFFTLCIFVISTSFVIDFGSFIKRKKEKRYMPALVSLYREKPLPWP